MLHVTTAAITDPALVIGIEGSDDTVVVFREGLMSAEALETLRLLSEYFEPIGQVPLRAVG